MGQIKNIKLHIVTDIKYKSSIASSATTMTVTASPLILWAQRADKVFVSVQLGDITNQEINLEKDKLSFKADAQGKKWETTIEFDGTVKPEESTQKNMGREYFFELCKTDPGPFWPRLTKMRWPEEWEVWAAWAWVVWEASTTMPAMSYERLNNLKWTLSYDFVSPYFWTFLVCATLRGW